MYYIEDTNVISRAASDEAFLSRLEMKRRELEREGFAHAIVPPLLFELFAGLAEAPSDLSWRQQLFNFDRGKRRFELLYPRGSAVPTILPYGNAFALKAALNLDSRKRLPPDEIDYGRAMKIISCAQNPEELWRWGVQTSPDDSTRRLIDRVSICTVHDRQRFLKNHLMQDTRDGKFWLTRDDFAREVLKQETILHPEDYQVAAISKALDGAYCYFNWLLNQARKGYNFISKKHDGDSLDYAFLLYLANPNLRFLTQDRRIKARVSGSPQAEQILLIN